MTFKQWYEVSAEITRKTEKRMRTGKPHAKEDAIRFAVKRHRLLFVELDHGGSIFGLIEKAGSRWAFLVGVSSNRHRVLAYVIRTPDDKNWTPEELQMIYLETVNKRNAKQDAE